MAKRSTPRPRLSVVPDPPSVAAPRSAATEASGPAPGLFELDEVMAPAGPPADADPHGAAQSGPDEAADRVSAGDGTIRHPDNQRGGPVPTAITVADILRKMADLGAPPSIMSEAETFGDDAEALLAWLQQFAPDGSAETSLLALLEHWKVLLKRGTTALDAELCAAEFLAMFGSAIGDLDLVEGLAHLIEEAATTGSPEALAMCRALAHLGPDEVRPAANRAAHTLAAAGAREMPWAHALGRAEFAGAFGYADPDNAQQSLALEFRYGKRRHVIVVLIDHELGGGIKDCFVSDEPARLFAEMRLVALQTGLELGPRSAEQAASILQSALAAPPCPGDLDQQEDVATYLPILRERSRALLPPRADQVR